MKLEQEKIDKIEEITLTNYESVDGVISIENIECIIDDLLCEIENLREKLEETYYEQGNISWKIN